MTFQNKDMGGFRKLDANEIKAVCGGFDDDIVVNGVLPEPIDYEFDPFIGIPDGFVDGYTYDLNGADAPPEDPDLCTNHTDPNTTEESSDNSNSASDNTAAGSAVAAEIANDPASQVGELGSALYRASDGSILHTPPYGTDQGAVGIGQHIAWLESNGYSESDITGFVHNHDAEHYGDSPELNRYPSPGDWLQADAAIDAGADPAEFSLIVIDTEGVAREFKYSDKELYTIPDIDPNSSTTEILAALSAYDQGVLNGVNLPPPLDLTPPTDPNSGEDGC